MSAHQEVKRDERTVAVENASYKWAFTFVTFALLVDMMCRAVFFREAAWDLFALACVPGMVCTMYQARQKILGHGWLWKMTLLGFVAAVVAAVTAAIITVTKVM